MIALNSNVEDRKRKIDFLIRMIINTKNILILRRLTLVINTWDAVSALFKQWNKINNY